MAERYDSILVRVEIGNSRKLRRFPAEQRWCVMAGVWALAAKAPTGLRGYLLVTPTEPVTDQDVAEQAGVKLSVARLTLARMRDLGMLEQHENGEYVHDWHDHQPEPAARKPSDSSKATAERKRKQRAKERDPGACHADVTRVTSLSVTPLGSTLSRPLIKEKRREEKRKDPPTPPRGGRDRDQQKWRDELDVWVQAHPVSDDLVDEWEQLVEPASQLLGMVLGYLHPHRLGDAPVLGVARSSAIGALSSTQQTELRCLLGGEFALIDCRCELTREHAA